MSEIIERPPITPLRLYRQWLSGYDNEKTKKAYRLAWKHFADSHGLELEEALYQFFSNGPIHATGMLNTFRERMLAKGLSSGTINTHQWPIMTLLKYAREQSLLGWVPYFKCLKYERLTDTKGPHIRTVKAVLNKLAKKNTPSAKRTICYIRLLVNPALRGFEARGLDLEHVDLENMRVHVLAKGKKNRTPVTIPQGTANAIRDWLEVRPEGCQALFCTMDGKRRIIPFRATDMLQEAGIKSGHRLRHCGITTALDKTGGDIRKVQRFARHANPEMTLKYDDNREDLGGQVASAIDF